MRALLSVLLLTLLSYHPLLAQITFAPAVSYASGAGALASAPQDVVVADFDNDGKQDLATANRGNGLAVGNSNFSVLLGNGNGTFNAPTNFATPSPSNIAVGYFNNDTKPDIVTTSWVTGSQDPSVPIIAVFLNTSVKFNDVTFAAPVNYEAGTHNDGRDVVVGKLNADNFDDIAVTDRYSGKILVFLNNGSGGFPATPVSYTGVGNPASIAVGDFNNDGNNDLVSASASNDHISVLIGSGTGTFATPVSYPMGTGQSVTVGKFNGDAYDDVVVINNFVAPTATLSVRLGSASGTLGAVSTMATSFSAVYRLAHADFNGDGKLDLATSNGADYSATTYTGDGTGSFSTPTTSSLGTPSPFSTNAYGIATGDLNGDSKPDMVITNSAGSNVSVLLNTSPINTITTGTLAQSGYCAGSSMVVPFTYNGTFNAGNLFRVQLSDASGSFSTFTPLTTLVTGANSLTVGIPAGTINSALYRVRVVATNPAVNGTPNPTNLTISSSPVAAITITASNTAVCASTPTVTLTASSTDNLTYTWTGTGLVQTTGANVTANPPFTTTYTVRGTNGTCSRTSNITIEVFEGCRVAVTELTTEETNEQAAMTTYPNPVTDRLTVKSITEETGYIQFQNAQGQVIKQLPTTGKETTVNVSDLTASLYIVHLVQGKHRESKRIQIAH